MDGRLKKTALAALALLSAAVLELKFKTAFGWSFDFILVALILPGFFLDIWGAVFFWIFSFWLLGAVYPLGALELGVLAGLYVLIFCAKRFFPWQYWLEPFFAVVFGILIFYGAAAPGMFRTPAFLLPDLAVSSVFAWCLYLTLRSAAKR